MLMGAVTGRAIAVPSRMVVADRWVDKLIIWIQPMQSIAGVLLMQVTAQRVERFIDGHNHGRLVRIVDGVCGLCAPRRSNIHRHAAIGMIDVVMVACSPPW